MRRGTATLLVVAAALGLASISIFTTYATRTGALLTGVLFYRYLLASAALLAAGGVSGLRQVSGPRLALLTIVGGPLQASIAFLTLFSLRYITAATLVFLFYTFPAWMALIEFGRGAERLDGRRLAALALSFAGVVVIVGGSARQVHPLGAALALGAAIIYAAYIPFVHSVQQGARSVSAAALISLGSMATFALWGTLDGTFAVPFPPQAWAFVVPLALISTALSFFLLLRGLAVLGPVRTGIVATVEPFFVALQAALFLGQPLQPSTLAGGGAHRDGCPRSPDGAGAARGAIGRGGK